MRAWERGPELFHMQLELNDVSAACLEGWTRYRILHQLGQNWLVGWLELKIDKRFKHSKGEFRF